MISFRRFTIASLFCLIVTGCGGPLSKPEGIQVRGKALLQNGSPLTGGTLILRPEDGLFGATALIQPDGSFTLQDGGNQVMVPGKYQVFVRFPDPSQDSLRSMVNGRYQQSSEDGDSDVVIDIHGATDDLIIRFNR